MTNIGKLIYHERMLLIKVHKLINQEKSVEEISLRLNISKEETKLIIREIVSTEI